MKIILLILNLFFSLTTYAQTLKGKVVNEQNAPVAFANVLLLDTDSVFIDGDITYEDGTFQIAVTNQAAILKISYIGYQDQLFHISGKSDMGIIRLKEETELLDEVVVKGNLPITRIKGDALVTSVENSVLSKVGSANDVLSKIPGITKKEEGFEVFGKGEPLIYINGRELRNKHELEQLSSDEIKSVELVTNPGSHYDATVNAVVRIQTVKREGDGFGIDVRSSYYQSQNTDLIESLDFNYRHNSLDVFGGIYYDRNQLETTINNIQQNSVGDIWTQENRQKNHQLYNFLNGTFGVNYLLNENHSLGARYDITGYPTFYYDTKINNSVFLNGDYYDFLLNTSHNNYSNWMAHTLNVYYNGKAGNLGVDLNIDYFKNSYSLDSRTEENSQDKDDRLVISQNPVDNQLAAAKLVFYLPIGDGKLSWGSEYTYTLRTDDYLSGSMEYVPTSYSKIQEHNIAVFAEYRRSLPFGQFSVGARYEHDAFDYYENHSWVKEQSRKFDNIFPNASFGTKIGNVQMQLGYAAKTLRPAYNELSNNIFYFNRFSLKQGNPALKPTLIHDLSLATTWRFIQAMVSLNHQKDAIFLWSNPVEETPEISMISFRNFNKMPTLNVMLAASPTIGCWNPTISAGMKKQWLEVDYAGSSIQLNKPMWMATFNNIVNLPWGLAFGADFSFKSKGHYQTIYMKRNSYILDLSLRKSFMDDALSLELRGNDLFLERKSDAISYINRLLIMEQNVHDSREFVFTVRYKFNSAPSKYKGTGAGTEQKNRF